MIYYLFQSSALWHHFETIGSLSCGYNFDNTRFFLEGQASQFQWFFVPLDLGSPHSLYGELLSVKNAPLKMEVVRIVETLELFGPRH